jgi:quinol monooxygenase YgiN
MPFIPRRGFFATMAGFLIPAQAREVAPRHGLHGKVTAHPGQRDALARILLDAAAIVGDAKGCEVYIVGLSEAEPDDLWVTEVWRSEADHDASLAMEGVADLIAKARPLIAGGAEAVRTIPLGGRGLPEG